MQDESEYTYVNKCDEICPSKCPRVEYVFTDHRSSYRRQVAHPSPLQCPHPKPTMNQALAELLPPILVAPSPSIAVSEVFQPAVKSRRFFFSMNFNICKASIKAGLMRFGFLVSVSAADEKTRSHGTEDAWMGRKSMAIAKSVGNSDL